VSSPGAVARPHAPWLPASLRLRLIAAVVAAGLGAAAFIRFGFGPHAAIMALFLGVLALLASIDLERHLLPNKLVLPAAAAVLAAQLAFFGDRAPEWIGYSVGTAAVLLVLALAVRGGLGMGDVKLGLLLGAGLGAHVVSAGLIGMVSIWPLAVFFLMREGGAARQRALPFGPALALGAAIVALAAG
jgi:prepilin signal peptidase PulO-like enzyme (type II secretory pathway)